MIAGAAGHRGDVNLIAVVLSGAVDVDTGLDGVISSYFGDAIGGSIDGSARVRRVRSAAKAIKGRNGNSRNFSGDVLTYREDVREVDTERTAIEPGQIRVHGDIDVVNADGRTSFVNQSGADGVSPAESVGLVGTMEVFASQPGALVERLIFIVREICAAELNVVFVAGNEIAVISSFALINGMCGLCYPVLSALQEAWRWAGIGI